MRGFILFNMVNFTVSIILFVVWIYILLVLYRADLKFWHYIVGSIGTFIFFMTFFRELVTMPLARIVAALAGIVGDLTGAYHAFYKYGVIFIESFNDSITVRIDLECSGIIEITIFVSLLAFFRVYSIPERVYIGIIGVMYTIFSNAIRLTCICLMIHFFGTNFYYMAHTVIGRIIFYVLQVILYFMVFTKPQVIRTKVGSFSYRKKDKEN